MSLHDEFVGPLTHGLKALSRILDKAEAHCAAKKIDPAVLIQARLFPDMFALARQVEVACDQGRRAIFRMKGEEPQSAGSPEATFDGLRAYIADTVAALEALTPEAIAGAEARTIRFKAGAHDVVMDGTSYIRRWILPNFYFHLTTAYNILRHNGLELGKADFLGA